MVVVVVAVAVVHNPGTGSGESIRLVVGINDAAVGVGDNVVRGLVLAGFR